MDPCAKYELPPPFPAVFSTFYTETVTTCDNKRCTNTTIIGDMQQNATAGEQRHDIVGTGWNTRFIFPFRYIDFDDFIQVYYVTRYFEHWVKCYRDILSSTFAVKRDSSRQLNKNIFLRGEEGRMYLAIFWNLVIAFRIKIVESTCSMCPPWFR